MEDLVEIFEESKEYGFILEEDILNFEDEIKVREPITNTPRNEEELVMIFYIDYKSLHKYNR